MRAGGFQWIQVMLRAPVQIRAKVGIGMHARLTFNWARYARAAIRSLSKWGGRTWVITVVVMT